MKKIVQDISFLRKKSEPVESAQEASDLIKQLEVVLNSIDHGIGLAAIQIGEPKRVGVIQRVGKTPVYLINPEIIEQKEEFIFVGERCLSLPKDCKDTERYRHVIIKNHRIEGDELKEEQLYFYYSSDITEQGNDGLTAIALQHELEHMGGGLILDHNIKGKTIKKNAKKIGRNDPCSCGSGKKYKKCCLD